MGAPLSSPDSPSPHPASAQHPLEETRQSLGFREGLTDWAELGDLVCSRCGYGIARRTPPHHCPMCHATDEWANSPMRHAKENLTGVFAL